MLLFSNLLPIITFYNQSKLLLQLMKLIYRITVILLLTTNSSLLIAQHADCDKMIHLKDSIYTAKNITGFGDKLEFSGNKLEDKHVFETEKNTVWYLITMPDSGIFTFDIISKNKANDWDFLLYKYKKMFCKRIDAHKINPIRSNLSRGAITGLSKNATKNFVGAGINSNFSKAIKVNKGDRYVLVVNNPKKSHGNHTLILHYPKKKHRYIKKEITIPEQKRIKFELSIKDRVTKELVPANVNITGFSKTPIVLTNITNYKTDLTKRNRIAVINVSAKNYLLKTIKIKILTKKSFIKKEIFLSPIAIGEKINLTDIQFVGEAAIFLPTAKTALKSLLDFMKINTTTNITIGGYVNGPGEFNTKSNRELSKNRAKAVRDFLIKNGIDESRMSFKGYGNSNMLYPHPKNAREMSANRRVEIKITAQ